MCGFVATDPSELVESGTGKRDAVSYCERFLHPEDAQLSRRAYIYIYIYMVVVATAASAAEKPPDKAYYCVGHYFASSSSP